MDDENETIDLKCPLCGDMHNYELRVYRTMVMYQMTSQSFSEKAAMKRFRRLFSCVKDGQPFEAVIALPEPFGIIINDVSVV
jgi:hypothetical protein